MEKQITEIEHLIELQKLGSVDLGPGDILIVQADSGKLSPSRIPVYFAKIEDHIRHVLNAVGHNEVEILVVNKSTDFSVLKMAEHPII